MRYEKTSKRSATIVKHTQICYVRTNVTTSRKENQIVLVTVSGPDSPGITSELTHVLAQANAIILDIGQAVIHHLLSLSILFEMPASDTEDKSTIKELLFKATELGLKLEFQVFKNGSSKNGKFAPKAYRYAVTLIANAISAQALHEVTAVLAKYKMNIDVIERLSEGDFGCIEMLVSSSHEPNRHLLKKELLAISKDLEVDIALQAEGLYRRAKRMVVFDLDSTLIQAEIIDELAREKGVFKEISALTHQAMNGKLDFDESLRLRCEKLKGLSMEDIEKVYRKIQLTPGAEELIKILKKLGYKIALISGGFSCIAERFKEKLGIHYVYANTFEFEKGILTGKLLPPIINAQRKADLLDVIAQQENISLDQVIAIGDGANDILMLEKAGLGIAFNAKSIVKEKADLALSQKSLRSILYLLGISGRDLSEILM